MNNASFIQRVAEAALAAVDSLLSEWLPDGKRKGAEWWARNPTRGDRHPGSFSVSLESGRWHDFASGDGGGDFVSLLAYLLRCGQMDAALMIAERLGIPVYGQPKRDFLQEEAERQRIARQRKQRQQQDEAEQYQRQQAAAVEAQRLWSASAPAAPDHPYLVRKGIQSHNARQQGDVLLIPLYANEALVNLQRIYPDGRKRFLSGGRVKGAYSLLGHPEPGKPLYICEGWATGATLHEYEGAAVACAMNAGNLLAVGQYLQRHYPDAELVIAGDDDRQTEGNTGRDAANDAALTIGAEVTFPAWRGDEPLHLSDFNDLATWRAAHEQA
ncbi:toprim domain-containing protein [Azotobacter salinestris]|uniref:toprim domain-containing protein n=1 Tax=Azotobacter salinestris TaxID=69964 RepID=UPI001266C630|nr:toprim domain-containing protein [Azotobacter salinestris]